MKANSPSLSTAFTLVEVLAVLAGLAVITSVGYVSVRNTKDNADAQKLNQDVASINRSILVYQSSGGNLAGITNVDGALAALKTRADSSRMLGVAGSAMDARVYPVYQTAAEAGTTKPRAVWNSSLARFQVVSTGSVGVKEFRLNEDLAASGATLDTNRAMTKQLATNSTWVWDNSPATQVASLSQGLDPSPGTPANAALSDALNQGFPGGYWTIGPTGIVPVTYVYREAGYASRLALFSLEDMGPDTYNLDTPEGQRQFLMEAIRRVMAGDRAQTIIDVSQDRPIANTGANQLTVIRDKNYTFRPGDTVAAIMIPNSSFTSAYNLLNNMGTLASNSTALSTLANNNKTVFPLTSLERKTAGANSNFPFYANQYASLGAGTSAYALEDQQGGGDMDYQDLIFKASGMTAPEGTKTNTIDPATYYGSKLDVVGTGGGMTLRQALQTAGIMP